MCHPKSIHLQAVIFGKPLSRLHPFLLYLCSNPAPLHALLERGVPWKAHPCSAARYPAASTQLITRLLPLQQSSYSPATPPPTKASLLLQLIAGTLQFLTVVTTHSLAPPFLVFISYCVSYPLVCPPCMLLSYACGSYLMLVSPLHSVPESQPAVPRVTASQPAVPRVPTSQPAVLLVPTSQPAALRVSYLPLWSSVPWRPLWRTTAHRRPLWNSTSPGPEPYSPHCPHLLLDSQ